MRKNRRMAPKENEAIEIEKNSQRPLTCVQSSSYGGLLGLSWDGTGFCYFFEKFPDSQPLAARAKSSIVPRGTFVAVPQKFAGDVVSLCSTWNNAPGRESPRSHCPPRKLSLGKPPPDLSESRKAQTNRIALERSCERSN